MFRGRNSGGGKFRGGGRGGGGGRGRGGGRSSFNDMGPPDQIIPFGYYTYTCQDDLILKVELDSEVPFFNAPIYTQDKNQIGKIDEIFGPIKDYFVSVKLTENISTRSFRVNDKLFIDPRKLLPLQRFLPAPPGAPKSGGGRGRGGGGRGRGGAGRGGGRGRGGGGGGGFRRDSGGFRRDGGGRRDSGGFRGGGRRGGGGFRGGGGGRKST